MKQTLSMTTKDMVLLSLQLQKLCIDFMIKKKMVQLKPSHMANSKYRVSKLYFNQHFIAFIPLLLTFIGSNFIRRLLIDRRTDSNQKIEILKNLHN